VNAGRVRLQTAHSLPPASDPSVVRAILAQGLGVLRDGNTIGRAVRSLYPIANSRSAASDPAMVGLMIAVSAYRREESRGGHFRDDFPEKDPSYAKFNIVIKRGPGGEVQVVREPISEMRDDLKRIVEENK